MCLTRPAISSFILMQDGTVARHLVGNLNPIETKPFPSCTLGSQLAKLSKVRHIPCAIEPRVLTYFPRCMAAVEKHGRGAQLQSKARVRVDSVSCAFSSTLSTVFAFLQDSFHY